MKSINLTITICEGKNKFCVALNGEQDVFEERLLPYFMGMVEGSVNSALYLQTYNDIRPILKSWGKCVKHC